MKTIIICIGNELTSGHTVNTNSAWIARALEPYGVTPDRVALIKDDIPAIVKDIRSAIKRYELVLITGGLGPTSDDLTKPALLKVFRTKLVRDEKTVTRIRRIFSKNIKTPMSVVNLGQADIPEGSEALPNDLGTAPGLLFTTEIGLLFALPGVPREMKGLMEKQVLPRIKKDIKTGEFMARTVLHIVGIVESAIYAMIEKSGAIGQMTELAYLPGMGKVDLRLTMTAESRTKANRGLNAAITKLMKVIKPYCYGRDDQTLESVIGKIMTDKGLTLASAESCTGGMLASRITSVAGASRYFMEGLITYNNEAKMKRAGVCEDTLIQYGAVSARVAEQMAVGVRESSGADIGLSSTGIAGPSGGTKNKPVGLVFIGMSIRGKTRTKELRFGSDRRSNQERATLAMLTWLWREIRSEDDIET